MIGHFLEASLFTNPLIFFPFVVLSLSVKCIALLRYCTAQYCRDITASSYRSSNNVTPMQIQHIYRPRSFALRHRLPTSPSSQRNFTSVSYPLNQFRPIQHKTWIRALFPQFVYFFSILVYNQCHRSTLRVWISAGGLLAAWDWMNIVEKRELQ